jgi:hypothetical protein
MVVKPAQAALPQMYSQYIDRIICLHDLHDVCERIQQHTTFDLDQPLIAHPFWHGDGRIYELTTLFQYRNRGGLLFADHFRYILRLPWTSELVKPTIPDSWRNEAVTYAREQGMVAGKSVILFPDNNTHKTLPVEFWKAVAARLQDMGNLVFTNLVGGEYTGPRPQPIEGTKGITVTLQHVFPLAEFAGQVISSANGLRVMLLAADVNADFTTIIYQPAEGEQYNHLPPGLPPATAQSLKYQGVRDWSNPAREYVVRPSDDFEKVAADIVRKSPAHPYEW